MRRALDSYKVHRSSVPIAPRLSQVKARNNAPHSVKPGEVSMPNVAVACEDERGRVSSLFVLESVVIAASCTAWHGREGGREGG